MLLCACLLLTQAATAKTIVVGSSGVVTSATSTGFISTDEPDGSVRIWRLRPKSHQFELFEAFFPEAERPPTDGYSFITQVSPDGRNALIHGTGSSLLLYSLRPVKRVRTYQAAITGLPVWSPDGRQFTLQDGDHTSVVDVSSDSTWTAPIQYPFVFSQNGRYLAGRTPKGAALLDLKGKKLVQTFAEELETTMPFDISPDGKWLATGGEDPSWRGPQLTEGEVATEAANIHRGTIKIWRVSDGKRARLLPGPTNGYATAIFFLDSRRLMAPSMGVIYDVATGKAIRCFRRPSDGDSLGRPVLPMDHRTPFEVRWGILPIHPGVGRGLAISGDGRLAVGTLGDGNFNMLADEVSVWRLRDLTKLRTLHARSGGSSMSFSSHGSLLVSGNGRLEVFDRSLSPKRLPAPPKVAHFVFHDVQEIQVLPGARNALIWGGEGEWKTAYELRSGRSLAPVHVPRLGSTYQPDSLNTVSVERTRSGRAALVLRDREETPLWMTESQPFSEEVAFSSDGKRLAGVVYEDRKMQPRLFIADAATGRLLARQDLREPPGQILFSPDGARLAIRTTEGIETRDARFLKLLAERTLPFRSASIQLAFSPNGRLLAVARGALDVVLLDSETLVTTGTLVPFDDGNWVSWDRTGRVRGSRGGRARLRTVTERGLLPVKQG